MVVNIHLIILIKKITIKCIPLHSKCIIVDFIKVDTRLYTNKHVSKTSYLSQYFNYHLLLHIVQAFGESVGLNDTLKSICHSTTNCIIESGFVDEYN